jgi:hypothetical protein
MTNTHDGPALHFDDGIEVEVLDNALERQIEFASTFDPGPMDDDDRDEVIAGHRADADVLRVLLLRLRMLGI